MFKRALSLSRSFTRNACEQPAQLHRGPHQLTGLVGAVNRESATDLLPHSFHVSLCAVSHCSDNSSKFGVERCTKRAHVAGSFRKRSFSTRILFVCLFICLFKVGSSTDKTVYKRGPTRRGRKEEKENKKSIHRNVTRISMYPEPFENVLKRFETFEASPPYANVKKEPMVRSER